MPFIALYHFDGDAEALTDAHDKMLALTPPEDLGVHICVRHAAGITVIDSCPSRQDFEAFSTGPGLRELLDAVGLPAPRIEPLGETHEPPGTTLG
jgi:1,6-anhydro-N-acetylmuramate kinase